MTLAEPIALFGSLLSYTGLSKECIYFIIKASDIYAHQTPPRVIMYHIS